MYIPCQNNAGNGKGPQVAVRQMSAMEASRAVHRIETKSKSICFILMPQYLHYEGKTKISLEQIENKQKMTNNWKGKNWIWGEG